MWRAGPTFHKVQNGPAGSPSLGAIRIPVTVCRLVALMSDAKSSAGIDEEAEVPSSLSQVDSALFGSLAIDQLIAGEVEGKNGTDDAVGRNE